MVENFGSYLKHERELRGVPLEEISGSTKIHIRFLKALEDNHFDELPGEVFIKGYIRSYANTIGSDEEEMLNIYEESVGKKSKENNPNPVTQSIFSSRSFLGFVLLTFVILGLFFGVRFFVTSGNNPQNKEIKSGLMEKQNTSSLTSSIDIAPEEEIAPSKVESTSLEIDSSRQEASDVSVQEVSQEPFTQNSEVVNNDNPAVTTEMANIQDLENTLKLTIKVQNNSWFNMTIDNFREEDFILPSGAEKSFFGNKVFRLTIGNELGTEIFLNGKKLNLPESKDNVVKNFIINSKLIE